jgi:glycosyltransferase involved in cell wall biosynthesis
MEALAASGKTRLLLLTDEMEVGGTQRQIVHIAAQLDRNRFEPTVLFFRNPSFFVDELEQAGVKVIQVPKRGRLDPQFVWRLARELRRGRFDVMHCFAFSGELWGAVARTLLPRAIRPALISSVRGTYEWYTRWHWAIKRRVSAQSSRVVANSHMGAQYACRQMGLPEQAISVVHNGVQQVPSSGTSAGEHRARLGTGPGELLILFVGRLVDHKDLPTLLRATARLRDRSCPARIVIAGDGPLRAEIEGLIAKLALRDRVCMLGQRDDIPDLIAAADVVVLPSVREGLSNVILEGMMGGKPVVASRAGGNIELVEHDRSGLLFDVGDDAALAEAFVRLAQDSSLRKRLGDGARSRAHSHFSIPSMVRAYEKTYGDVVRERVALH